MRVVIVFAALVALAAAQQCTLQGDVGGNNDVSQGFLGLALEKDLTAACLASNRDELFTFNRGWKFSVQWDDAWLQGNKDRDGCVLIDCDNDASTVELQACVKVGVDSPPLLWRVLSRYFSACGGTRKHDRCSPVNKVNDDASKLKCDSALAPSYFPQGLLEVVDVKATCTLQEAGLPSPLECPAPKVVNVCHYRAGQTGDAPDDCIFSTSAVCGNNVVEDGEECDGGACCHPSTCRLKSAGSECRGAAGPCDIAETCSGTSASCPEDELAPASTVCRPAASPCDVAETCSGFGPNCGEDKPGAATPLGCQRTYIAATATVLTVLPNGTHGVCASNFANAKGITADREGNLFVTDEDANKIWRIPRGCGEKVLVAEGRLGRSNDHGTSFIAGPRDVHYDGYTNSLFVTMMHADPDWATRPNPALSAAPRVYSLQLDANGVWLGGSNYAIMASNSGNGSPFLGNLGREGDGGPLYASRGDAFISRWDGSAWVDWLGWPQVAAIPQGPSSLREVDPAWGHCGALFFAATGNGRAFKCTSNVNNDRGCTSLCDKLGPGTACDNLVSPYGIAADCACNVHITAPDSHKVVVYSAASNHGSASEFLTASRPVYSLVHVVHKDLCL